MTLSRLEEYKGIMGVVRRSSKIKDRSSWVHVYINFDEKRIKTEKETDDDFFLTNIIRPCKKTEVMEIIMKMLAM